MKLTMPILAVVVALLLVASQSLYTVDQRQYAIRFQLGEVIETQASAGLYTKVPIVQNIKYYDKRVLLLDNGSKPRGVHTEKGVIRETAYAGMVTRYVVDLDAGGELQIVRQNSEAPSEDLSDERGRKVTIGWRARLKMG